MTKKLSEEELHKLYFPEEYEEVEEEKSLEDYEEEIFDSRNYELIKSRLGQDIADLLFFDEEH